MSNHTDQDIQDLQEKIYELSKKLDQYRWKVSILHNKLGKEAADELMPPEDVKVEWKLHSIDHKLDGSSAATYFPNGWIHGEAK